MRVREEHGPIYLSLFKKRKNEDSEKFEGANPFNDVGGSKGGRKSRKQRVGKEENN